MGRRPDGYLKVSQPGLQSFLEEKAAKHQNQNNHNRRTNVLLGEKTKEFFNINHILKNNYSKEWIYSITFLLKSEMCSSGWEGDNSTPFCPVQEQLRRVQGERSLLPPNPLSSVHKALGESQTML